MKKKKELIQKITKLFRQIEKKETELVNLVYPDDDIMKAKAELNRLKAEYNEIAKDIHLYLFT